jgi:hypothetical protein
MNGVIKELNEAIIKAVNLVALSSIKTHSFQSFFYDHMFHIFFSQSILTPKLPISREKWWKDGLKL